MKDMNYFMTSKATSINSSPADIQLSPKGKEVIADLYGINKELLKDERLLTKIFKTSLINCGFTILESSSHKFKSGGEGVTGLFLLSESHATYHSYPEWNTIAVNIFSCGSHDPEEALKHISKKLKPDDVRTTVIDRYFTY